MKKEKIIIRISVVVTVLVMVTLGLKGLEVRKVMREIDSEIVATQKQLEKDKKVLDTLQEEKKQLNSTQYIEKVAREKLGMVKEEDIVFKQKKASR